MPSVLIILVGVYALSVPAFGIIGGVGVDSRDYPSIASVVVNNGSSSDTVTIVGARAFLTPGHLLRENKKTKGSLRFGDELYDSKVFDIGNWEIDGGLDLAVGFTDRDIVGAIPVSVSQSVALHQVINFFGFAESSFSQTAKQELKMGEGSITTLHDTSYRIAPVGVGGQSTGGDGGGPAWTKEGAGKELLGIIIRTGRQGTSEFTRLDTAEIQALLLEFSKEHSVEICGINAACP